MITLFTPQDYGFIAFTWTAPLFGQFNKIKEALKAYPGCHYAGNDYGKGVWLLPEEGMDHIQYVAESYGIGILDKREKRKQLKLLRPLRSGLYKFQEEAITRLINERALLIYFDGGLGKSLTAMEAFCATHTKGYVLIGSMPSVRKNWEMEIKKWYLGKHTITPVKGKKDALEIATRIQNEDAKGIEFIILSYALLKHFNSLDLQDRFAFLIADEVHRLKDEKSQQHKEWVKLLQVNKDAMRCGLTATPIANNLEDLPGQVSALWPKRFGTWWQFTEGYFHCTSGSHGGRDVGLPREEFFEELQERVVEVSIRATKEEYGHLLPSLTVQRIEAEAKRERIDRSIKIAERDYLDYLKKHADKHIELGIEWAEGCGDTHVTLLTYHVDTARKAVEILQAKGINTALITGEDVPDPDKRYEIIAKTLRQKSCILVCSMKSIGVGIDVLAGYSTFAFLELSYRVSDMIQAMERFYRLSSKKAVLGGFVILRGTLDSLVMHDLAPKLDQFSKVMDAGKTTNMLKDVLTEDKESDKDFFARLGEIAEKGIIQ